MSARKAMIIAIALLLTVATGCLSITPFSSGQVREVVVQESPRLFERRRIVLLDVDGFISSNGGLWLAGDGTTVADVKEKLERAAADQRVKAVVLRIDSPGGAASASDVMYREVVRFKEQSGKPVVAALMGTAASGGYYVALGADRIVCSPTTVTGSVGVVMQLVNLEGLYDKIGLRSEVIKSGEKKDMGSPSRKMTDEERRILQEVNRALFDGFLEVVRAGRAQMSEQDLATIADGRIVTADQALELHMVDEIGYLQDAIDVAMELANVESAHVVLYRAFPHYNANIYATAHTETVDVGQALGALLRRRAVSFLYLWAPGL